MKNLRYWIVGMVLSLVAFPSYAAESTDSATAIPNNPMLQDTFVFMLGGFYSRNTTSASIGTSSGSAGVIVNFEDALDLSQRTLTPMGGFRWRATDNWRLSVTYIDVGRNASNILGSDITWGDYTFPAGTPVSSTYDFSDMRVSADYALFKRRDKEVGVGIGLHVAKIDTSINAGAAGAKSSNVTAPLPVLNLYGMFALTDEWSVSFSADWLSLNYDKYSGDIRNMSLDIVYQPFRHIGFGLGARTLVIDLTVDEPNAQLRALTSFQGPTVFMTATF